MKRIFRWLRITLSALALLLAVLLARTLLLSFEHSPVESIDPVALDLEQAGQQLARALRLKTLSPEDPTDFEGAPFLALHDHLRQAYPRLHQQLEREVVADYSLLYRWPGSEPDLKPLILLAHLDVVPASDETLSQWTHPPFAGVIADGYIWGRGAMDMKQSMMAQLEAIELLLARGLQPRRTLYLAFGHDEELGGLNGAASLARRLRELGVQAAFTLDEGSAIVEGVVPGVRGPAALIGVAEKGYLSLELSTEHTGGHSSMPASPTAIGRLATALHRLESRPLPARLDYPTSEMLERLAERMPFWYRLVIANRWLFEPLLLRMMATGPASNALIRTTTAPTLLDKAGVKENVLPRSAGAVVNFRLLPGDSLSAVTESVKTTVADSRVQIRQRSEAAPASKVSDSDSAAYRTLEKTFQQVFPDALVTPSLVIGGTDSKHYQQIAAASFRILPMRLTAADLPRIHGIDERISIEDYGDMIRFYLQLIGNLSELENTPQ